MTSAKELTTCLACGGTHLEKVLDLHDQPLANNFLRAADQAEEFYPLAVQLCTDCFHLQLTHAVDPGLIYKNYLYVSGTSNTQQEYMKWFADFAIEYFQHKPSSVLDIGCNDGTQLNYFKALGVKTYGIDPAENLLPLSSKQHTILCDFFNTDSAQLFSSTYDKVDCVVAQNSFAHNPDPLSYLLNLKKIMNPEGLFFIQTSQANMVINNEFDTIYHEHVNFYNINSMKALCSRAGFNLIDVQKTSIHGTSYVFVLSPSKRMPARIQNFIDMEKQHGLLMRGTYDKWSKVVYNNVEQLRNKGRWFKQQGFKLVGYGAAAKGNTLLNFSHLELDMIVDDNPLKQGMYSPGKHIPVVSVDVVRQMPTTTPVLFVPLAWNFYDEIRRRILAVRDVKEDRFMRYFPEVVVE